MPQDKPKKTLTEEQKKKMLEGRKKAHEKRKAEKDALKQKIAKEKELQKQAIQQQRDLLNSQELDKEQKKAVRNKLKELKQPKVVEEEVPVEVVDAVEEVAEQVQEVLKDIEDEEPPLPKSPSEPLVTPVITDEMYEKAFKQQAKVIEKTLPKEAQKLFKQTTNKFDFNLSLEDNINGMIEHVKRVVELNTKTAAAIREKQKV